MKIKTYEENTVMDFGKFKGLTISQVCLQQKSYLDWALKTVRWFYINHSTAKSLYQKYGLVLSQDAQRSVIDIQNEVFKKSTISYTAFDEDHSATNIDSCPNCGKPCEMVEFLGECSECYTAH